MKGCGVYTSFSAYYEGFFLILFLLDVTERVKNKGKQSLQIQKVWVSARNMADEQTTRLLVSRALDRNGLAHNGSRI